MIKNIAKEQVLERIKYENPWWSTNHIEDDYNNMKRRLYFDIFKSLVNEKDINRAVVLMGPRRVGKTVMLFHLIEYLIQSGINPKKIIFITIENPIYNNIAIEQLFAYAKEASGQDNKSKDWYVIFDEIQYCRNWEIHLKTLVDSYRHDKFIVSGSAAAALKLKSNESGAGRFTDFLLPPLTFNEYIHLKEYDNIIIPTNIEWSNHAFTFFSTSHINELNKHFIDYINFGGYPEVIFSERIQSNPSRYIKHDIVDKVLLRDLPSLYGINDVQELNSLFTTIAYNSANEFSFETLSNSGVPKNTLKKYLEYLEAAFLIKLVRRIDQSGKKFQRDNYFKIFLTNPSLRSALFSPLTAIDDNVGYMVETAIYSQFMHRESFTPWYARWNKGEVDMVALNDKNLKPLWALEIKWSNRYFEKPNELKSLLKFCQENKLKQAIVTTIDKEGIKTIDGIEIIFVPAATYAYTIGCNTLNRKKI